MARANQRARPRRRHAGVRLLKSINMKIEMLVHGKLAQTWDLDDQIHHPDDTWEQRAERTICVIDTLVKMIKKEYAHLFFHMPGKVELRAVTGSRINDIEITDEEF